LHPKIIMHLGAHKTASTHLQRSLKKNQNRLNAAGYTYFTPKQCRDALFPITLRLRDGGDRAALQKHAEMMFHGAANGNANLILSDENIIGHLNQLFNNDLIYPWSNFRTARFFALLPDHRFELFISLRNMASFLPSAYVENLLHSEYLTFEQFLKGTEPWAFSWATMMRRFGNMSGGRQFTVWRYEDYGAIKSDIVAAMTTTNLAKGFKFLNKRPRPILSHAAVDYYANQRISGRSGPAADLLQDAGELFPLGEQYPAFQPFDRQTIEKLDEKYLNDMKLIANMAHVRMISPPIRA